MKRFALLIGSPSDPSTPKAGKYLSGVKTDIDNMYRFLTSSVGGSWLDTEIKSFYPNPSYSDINPYLQYCESMDFSFIYFSGHGNTNENKIQYIQLNEKESIPVLSKLDNISAKQITIVDACRSFPKSFAFDGEILLESIEFPNQNLNFAKAIFFNYLSILPDTRVLLCATSEGENSIDYGRKYGGLFSTSLLSVVKNKLKTDSKTLYNIEEIFNIAKINTQKIQPTQVPQIYFSNKNSHNLPFAINPILNFSQIDVSKKIFNKNDTIIIKNIAKRTLIGGSFLFAGYVTGYVIGRLISRKKK